MEGMTTAELHRRLGHREPTYGTRRAAELAGVTYRQVDYWQRTSVITPWQPASGSGSRARFSAVQVLQLALLGRLAELGATHDPLAGAVRAVDMLGVDGWFGSLVAYPSGEVHLVNTVQTAAWVVDLAAVRRTVGAL